ncbi:unnamed protein product [Cylicocyclus nassatus]|uniref:Uncharacterized protein n=1 Tax=Cylicocyclus nassatus TaxID=53992 RepID=A0AA36GTI4_CYLNA|nr:unnamed protein product [Cylicocyclus nassatus]
MSDQTITGLRNGFPPPTRQLCPPGTRYCLTQTSTTESKQIISTRYSCGTFADCKKKGCETRKLNPPNYARYVKMCCCASDGCNKS